MANTLIPAGGQSPGHWEIGAETTFGTVASTFQYVRTLGEPTVGDKHLPVFEDESIRCGFHGLSSIPGATGMLPEGTTITFERYAQGLKSTAPSGTDMADFATDGTGAPLALVLECLFGGENADDNYTTTAADTHTTTKVYGTDLTSFTDGAGIVINSKPSGGSNKYEVNFISDMTDAATDYVDLRHALTQAPDAAGGSVISSGLTFYPTDAPTKSCSFRWIGALVDTTTPQYATFTGCRIDALEVVVENGKITKWTETWMLTSQTWTDDSATGASCPQTWTYPQPAQVVGGRCLLGSTEYGTKSWTLRYGNALQMAGDINATYGVKQYAKTGFPVEVEVLVSIDETTAQTLRAAYRARTSTPMLAYWGTGPGKMLGMSVPDGDINAYVEEAVDGILHARITLVPGEYTGDAGTGTVVDKPIYFFLG